MRNTHPQRKPEILGLYVLVLVLLASSCSPSPPVEAEPESDYPVTTVLLVRHAEKAAEPPDDPPLTQAGQKRSQQLEHVLRAAGIDALYTTQFLRTQQTVQPTATSLGLLARQFDADELDQLAARILSDHAGQVVLVVAHGETVLRLVKELGAEPNSEISASAYDDLDVFTVYGRGKATVVNLKYGDPI